MKQFSVSASAPTNYQLNAISFFGTPVRQSDGSLLVSIVFDTEDDAKAYLHDKVNNGSVSFEDTDSIHECIEELGYMTYDGITAIIDVI